MPMEPGWHLVKYYSLDSTENVTVGEDESRFYEYRMKVDRIYVDLTGPDIRHSFDGSVYERGDTVFVSPQTRLVLHGQDGESGLRGMSYSVDREMYEKSYEEPFTLHGYGAGAHYLELFAYDNVGNRNIDAFEVILDVEGPEASYHLSVAPVDSTVLEAVRGSLDTVAEGMVYPADALIYLSAQDDLTGVGSLSYSLNGASMREYAGAFQGLQRGRNRLLIRTVDLVGNVRERVVFLEAR